MPQNDIPDPLGDAATPQRVTRIAFLLIDDFSLMSFASISEPFRAANRLSGKTLYEWMQCSPDGGTVRASSGLTINVDAPIAAIRDIDILFVCAGGNPALFDDKKTFAAIRKLAFVGTMIGGVSGGPFVLANAGVLGGYRCTIHWEHEPAFAEAYPAMRLERGLYVVDRRRVTCAGGTAGLDLALELIGREHGPMLASSIADWYIRTQGRKADGAQRGSVAQRYRVSHKGLVKVLGAMEANIAEPLSRDELAWIAGVSVRQLERLFVEQLRTSISQQYLRLRLEAAMRLLRETDLSRTEVAVACGFVNLSHFSRTFTNRFAISPAGVRANL